MSVEPFNIRALKAREQDLFARAEDRRSYARTSAQATWHEAQSLQLRNSREEARQRSAMVDDLRVAAERLTDVRRERLRELYHAEMQAWQAELAARGLTIVTHHE